MTNWIWNGFLGPAKKTANFIILDDYHSSIFKSFEPNSLGPSAINNNHKYRVNQIAGLRGMGWVVGVGMGVSWVEYGVSNSAYIWVDMWSVGERI